MKPREWPAALPNPGSTRAKHAGCRCAPAANYFGRGDDGGLFEVAAECRMHNAPFVDATPTANATTALHFGSLTAANAKTRRAIA